MGQNYSTNDYELVAACSIDLEGILKNEFGARGNGLGELASCVRIPKATLSHVKYVRKARNKKLHDGDTTFDRHEFIQNYEKAREGLLSLAGKANQPKDHKTGASPGLAGGLIIGGLLAAGAVALAASKAESESERKEKKSVSLQR